MEDESAVNIEAVAGARPERYKADSSPVPGQASQLSAKQTDTSNNESSKRRCVSTACIACRKRKSKCDGGLPACAACSSVYHTECEYDPNSDHRRKGVYRKETDHLKTRTSTLQTLIQAILNYPQHEVADLVQRIRVCESLDKVAELVAAKANGVDVGQDEDSAPARDSSTAKISALESQLSNKMGELILEDGAVRFIGGTSNLLFGSAEAADTAALSTTEVKKERGNPITSWTTVTSDATFIQHLLDLYFSWHYTFFTILSKELFYEDFYRGNPGVNIARGKTEFCTPLLVNAILALACHFSSLPGSREDPNDSATAGDHFFKEAKRMIIEGGEFERPSLASVQALCLMSVREAGCARESRGWIYSGMAFRMSCDLGLNLQPAALASNKDTSPSEKEEDARRVTFWGCFLIDKCWSNYLGRLPTFTSSSNTTAPKVEVFPAEDFEIWKPVSDTGISRATSQPSRTRAISLQIVELAEISGDLVTYFYQPHDLENPPAKQVELKRLSEIHSRLEKWKRELPKEMEARDAQLPSILIMHMFFQLLYIHLFRPFLKYNQTTSPLPSHVSPRKYCTQAALAISKLLRLYKRTHGLRKIVNISVYIVHSACTIHLLNLPDKAAQRDFIHTVKDLEEISESWLCARRTLRILSSQARTWKIDLPEEAATILTKADAEFGALGSPLSGSPAPVSQGSPPEATIHADDKQQPYPPHPASTISHSASNQPHPVNVNLDSIRPAGNNNSANAGVAGTIHNTANKLPGAHITNTNALPLYTPASSGSNTNQPQQANPQDIESPKSSRKRPLAPNTSTEMFGGVEALLRDGQDWWIKDQSQLANGFGNWGFYDNSQPHRENLMLPAHGQGQATMDWSMGNMPEPQWPVLDSQQLRRQQPYSQRQSAVQSTPLNMVNTDGHEIPDHHSGGIPGPITAKFNAMDWYQ